MECCRYSQHPRSIAQLLLRTGPPGAWPFYPQPSGYGSTSGDGRICQDVQMRRFNACASRSNLQNTCIMHRDPSVPAPKISCEHKTRKTRCRLCGGGSICCHNNVRDSCKKCLILFAIAKHTGGQQIPTSSRALCSRSPPHFPILDILQLAQDSASRAATMPLRPVPLSAVFSAAHATDPNTNETADAASAASHTSSKRQRVLSHPLLIANIACPSTVGGGGEMLNGSAYGALHCTRAHLPIFAQFLIRRRRGAVRHGLPQQPHVRSCIRL